MVVFLLLAPPIDNFSKHFLYFLDFPRRGVPLQISKTFCFLTYSEIIFYFSIIVADNKTTYTLTRLL